MSNTDDEEIERSLRAHFRDHDQVTPLSVDTTKVAFALRNLDERVAALADNALASRGETEDTVRFVHDDVTVLVQISPGEAAVSVSPIPVAAVIEAPTGTTDLDIDESGAGFAVWSGIGRIRVTYPDRIVVTDPLRVPPTA